MPEAQGIGGVDTPTSAVRGRFPSKQCRAKVPHDCTRDEFTDDYLDGLMDQIREHVIDNWRLAAGRWLVIDCGCDGITNAGLTDIEPGRPGGPMSGRRGPR